MTGTHSDGALNSEVEEHGTASLSSNPDPADMDPGAEVIEQLAKLSPIAYDRAREGEAERLGVRVSTLDHEVRNARAAQREVSNAPVIETLEPWPNPVNGIELADSILEILNRHVQLPAGSAEAITVWTIGTYLFDRLTIWPRLAITSPEKRCGKTTLLELIDGLCHRSLAASNISSAAVYRCIESWQPTLLLDEADTFLPDNEELRGVINAGHRKSGAFVVRCDGEKNEPRKFSAWAPLVLAMIKLPPGTIADRSVIVRMERKLVDQHVDRITGEPRQLFLTLRQKALTWSNALPGTALPDSPIDPQAGNDRARDNWRPMFQIASAIGGNWPERISQAFANLTRHDEQEEDIGAMLLADIRNIFDQRDVETLHTREILDKLIDLEERPWSEWKRGNPLTPNSLAKLLKPYRIKSRQIWLQGSNRNGYRRKDIDTAWQRYAAHVPAESSWNAWATSSPLDSNDFGDSPPGESASAIKNLEPRNPSCVPGNDALDLQNPSSDPVLEDLCSEKPSEDDGSRGLDVYSGPVPSHPKQDDGPDLEVFEL